MECKHCGAEVELQEDICPACGKAQTEDQIPEQPVEIPEEETPETSEAEVPAAEGEEPAEALPEEMPEEVPEEVSEEPAQPVKKKLWVRVVAIVCCVVLALGLGLGVWAGVNGGLKIRGNDVYNKDNYTVSDAELAKAADKVVATVGGVELTNRQLQIAYWMGVYNFLDQNSSYLAYYGLNLSESLDSQYVNEGGPSYQQYFLQNALDTWHSYQALVLRAQAKGHKMSEEMRVQLEGMPASMETQAKTYGFADATDMIRTDMGPITDLDSYMAYMNVYFTAMDYFQNLYDSVIPTDAEIEAYYNAHAEELKASYGVDKESGKLVDVRHILVMPQGGTKDETGKTVYSEEEWEACRQAAQAILDEWNAGAATEDSFAALAMAKSEDPGSQSSGGLYTNVYLGQMVPPFEEWCFDETREYGDTGLVLTDYGYHVMFYVAGEEGWYRIAKEEAITQACTQEMESAVNEYPMEVQYRNIRLGDIDLMG